MKTSLMKSESGIALVTALLVLMLASGLMAGMFAALLASQRAHATDRDQSVAYAASHAGLEKLTSGLAALFATDFSPSAEDLSELDDTPPLIDGFEYTSPGEDEGSGYAISFTADEDGNPQALPSTDITTGPFEGFKGLITPYTLTVTARSITGNSEVRLRRELQTVAVPVFQFGIFGEKSLGFHAGPNFDFGGRVHTNENLYLANGDNNTLTFRDKITAVTQVVRNTLSNGVSIALTDHEGFVSIPRVIGGAPATYRNLLAGESSGTMATPWGGWKNLSEVTYATNIRTEATGAKRLTLPLATQGAQPIDLIRRPALNSDEDTENPSVFGQRYFAQASLRILLSDRAADLTGLPTITATAPLQLDAVGGPAGYVVAAGRPPVAQSPGNEPIDAANGTSLTRVQLGAAVNGPGNVNLLIQTAASSAGPWADALPNWLRMPANAFHAVNTIVVGGVNRVCTGDVEATRFRGCPALGASIPAGTVVSRTIAAGHTVTTTISPTVAAGSTNYTVVSTVGFTAGSRSLFIGEDVVTCQGYNAAAFQLRGCTWPATGTLNDDDPVYTGATTAATTPLLSGFIKIEKQDDDGVWTDVTLELLNLGFAARNQQGDLCNDPTPTAVIRLQRLRDNGYNANLCGAGAAAPAVSDYSASLIPTDFIPNMLYDAREGNTRLQNTGATDPGIYAGGLFGYVAIDVDNLRQWFAGTIGATGAQALNNNGYIIYFSDRRGDHDETNGDVETGEYGNEDSINPAAAAWVKTNQLEVGENFNESVDADGLPTIQMYGETPHALAVPAGAVANMGFTAAQRPWTVVPLDYTGRGRLARPVLFRRALKVTNGGMVGATNNLPVDGLTITAENPIYIQGNYNATAASVTAEPNRPAAIIGDSITLLSNSFADTMTFQFPHTAASRQATSTGFRFAMVTGKTIPFPKPAAWGVQELGSDGGVHNFMKMLESWNWSDPDQNLRYRGSMVSLYYSRQATGMYRADANIYGAPIRNFNFDSDFLTPTLLPPGTPMFRDINTLKFRQILRPNQ